MPRIPTLYMETTQISPERSSAEIISVLARVGATQINSTYKDGRITGIRWCFVVMGAEQVFEMPVRIDPITSTLRRAGRLPYSDKEKPSRVAWRQLLRWVEAQAALIETGMVEQAEPFAGYAIDIRSNRTFFQVWTSQLALPAPTNS